MRVPIFLLIALAATGASAQDLRAAPGHSGGGSGHDRGDHAAARASQGRHRPVRGARHPGRRLHPLPDADRHRRLHDQRLGRARGGGRLDLRHRRAGAAHPVRLGPARIHTDGEGRLREILRRHDGGQAERLGRRHRSHRPRQRLDGRRCRRRVHQPRRYPDRRRHRADGDRAHLIGRAQRQLRARQIHGGGDHRPVCLRRRAACRGAGRSRRPHEHRLRRAASRRLRRDGVAVAVRRGRGRPPRLRSPDRHQLLQRSSTGTRSAPASPSITGR